jgi:anthranilate synthase component 1
LSKHCIGLDPSPKLDSPIKFDREKIVLRANRPLAGTRRRGATKEEDDALATELLADGKECSEHVMLLDLGRNDVGRVSIAGSVKVKTA